MSYDIEKVTDSRDQDRCKASAGNNQCMNKAYEGTDFCKAHGGASIAARSEKSAIHKFREMKWYKAIKDEYDQNSIKSLHAEVAILKMLLTNMLNRIKDENDLMMQTGAVADLITKIDKVVFSCHKLDKDLSLLVDQATVMQFATTISEIVMKELHAPEDKHKLSNISNQIGVAFMTLVQSTGEIDD